TGHARGAGVGAEGPILAVERIKAKNGDIRFCLGTWGKRSDGRSVKNAGLPQPTIHVVLVSEGITSEVRIAPQVSAKRKANARGEAHVETQPPRLELVPDAKTRSMGDLQIEYGDKLRIACDPDATYAAITGSHLRVITRGRDKGVTVVHLGNVTGYDQKTCFYLVKQLVELNLVVKRRHGGVGTNFVVHKFIFDRSPSWKAVREEESKAEQRAQASTQAVNEAEEEEQMPAVKLDYPPIDSRHLSSLPLVCARVISLLKASKNNMHAAGNMIVTLGFTNPTKSDRRFFSSRIRELIEQGVIEKVIVPSKRKKSPKSSNVICLRLLDENATGGPSTSSSTAVPPEQEDEEEEDLDTQGDVRITEGIGNALLLWTTYDKRTVELLLTRAKKLPPPSHLSDLSIASLMETVGRERRRRYFIISGYRKLVEKDSENLDQSTAGYADIDASDLLN
ncbi:hypothetical protein MPER_08822, partial [Moniliophthora perniciosa FA553]